MTDKKLSELNQAYSSLDYIYGTQDGASKRMTPYRLLYVAGQSSSTNNTVEYLYGVYNGNSKRITPTNLMNAVFGGVPPTSDPHVANQVWIDNGVWKISTG